MTTSAADDLETGLLADGCVALMRVVFGDTNWYRFQDVRQQAQMTDLQSFFSWVLDVAEQELDGHKNAELSYSPNFPAFDLEAPAPEPPPSSSAPVNVEEIDIAEGEEDFPTSSAPVITFHFQQDTSQFFCTSCQVSLADIDIVLQHMPLRHPDQLYSINCLCCHRTFNEARDFTNHHVEQRELASGGRLYVCQHCSKVFRHKHNLRIHVMSNHTSQGLTYACPTCQKTFSRPDSYSRHKKACLAAAAFPS